MTKSLILTFLTASLLAVGCKTAGKSGGAAANGNSPAVVDGTDEPFSVNDNTVKIDPNETIGTDFGRGLLPDDFVNGERINHNFKPVYFAYDSAIIRQEEVAKLKMLAGFLESNPNLFLIIEGHCDERGSEEYNRALSERRALAIKEFVEKNASSVSPRINTIGYGEDKLADTALTNIAHAKNRRGEFIIISKR
ncbi:MAG: OmpA family protein [Lentisphaeraceae bacterium]|nr:OmpA family protein [Lentisphaeraceae bacterium]